MAPVVLVPATLVTHRLVVECSLAFVSVLCASWSSLSASHPPSTRTSPTTCHHMISITRPQCSYYNIPSHFRYLGCFAMQPYLQDKVRKARLHGGISCSQREPSHKHQLTESSDELGVTPRCQSDPQGKHSAEGEGIRPV